MKSLIRTLILNIAVIFFAAWILPGLSYSQNLETLIFAAITLALLNIFVRPLLKLLMLPINLLTLGIFSWVVNVFLLYLATRLIPGFAISAFDFGGLDYQGIVLPAMRVTTFASFALSSFLISLLTSFLGWLFD